MEQTTHITIYGNTMETWAVAAGLCKSLAPSIKKGLFKVTVIEPPTVTKAQQAITGNPKDFEFHALLGISEELLLSRCEGSLSLGYHYQTNVQGNTNPRYFCFGDYGYSLKGIPFQNIWKKFCLNEQYISYDNFSLSAQCAKQNKFVHPQKNRNPLLSSFDYAINLDYHQYSLFLKNLCLKLGVTTYETDIQSFQYNSNGHIESISLNNGSMHTSNLFIDTSLEKKLKNTSTETTLSVSSIHCWLKSKELRSSSTLKRHTKGWFKTTTLPQATHISFTPTCQSTQQHEAHAILCQEFMLPEDTQTNCQLVNLNDSETYWQGNTVSMGAATFGSVPICVSPLQLIFRQINTLIELMPQANDLDLCSLEYKRSMKNLAEDIDRINEIHKLNFFEPILSDSKLSSSHQHFVQLFKDRGKISFIGESLLSNTEWASLLISLGLSPQNYDPLLDNYDFKDQVKQLKNGLGVIDATTSKLPSISDYQSRYINHILGK